MAFATGFFNALEDDRALAQVRRDRAEERAHRDRVFALQREQVEAQKRRSERDFGLRQEAFGLQRDNFGLNQETTEHNMRRHNEADALAAEQREQERAGQEAALKAFRAQQGDGNGLPASVAGYVPHLPEGGLNPEVLDALKGLPLGASPKFQFNTIDNPEDGGESAIAFDPRTGQVIPIGGFGGGIEYPFNREASPSDHRERGDTARALARSYSEDAAAQGYTPSAQQEGATAGAISHLLPDSPRTPYRVFTGKKAEEQAANYGPIENGYATIEEEKNPDGSKTQIARVHRFDFPEKIRDDTKAAEDGLNQIEAAMGQMLTRPRIDALKSILSQPAGDKTKMERVRDYFESEIKEGIPQTGTNFNKASISKVISQLDRIGNGGFGSGHKIYYDALLTRYGWIAQRGYDAVINEWVLGKLGPTQQADLLSIFYMAGERARNMLRRGIEETDENNSTITKHRKFYYTDRALSRRNQLLNLAGDVEGLQQGGNVSRNLGGSNLVPAGSLPAGSITGGATERNLEDAVGDLMGLPPDFEDDEGTSA